MPPVPDSVLIFYPIFSHGRKSVPQGLATNFRICYTGIVPDKYITYLSGIQPPYLDNRIPAARKLTLQGKRRQDFAGRKAANERANGVVRSLARGIPNQRR